MFNHKVREIDVVDDSELQIEMEFGGMLNDLTLKSSESEL